MLLSEQGVSSHERRTAEERNREGSEPDLRSGKVTVVFATTVSRDEGALFETFCQKKGQQLRSVRQCRLIGCLQAELRSSERDFAVLRGPVYNGEFDPGSG